MKLSSHTIRILQQILIGKIALANQEDAKLVEMAIKEVLSVQQMLEEKRIW